jgi:cell wall-associated NlpC family hydrolase
MNWRPEFPHVGRAAAAVAVGMMLVMVLSLAIVGVVIGGGSVLFGAGQSCTGGTSASANGAAAGQPTASAAGRTTIPADYLHAYQQAGKKYGVPWVVLAGIGEVESNQGRTSLPGVHGGANAFGAAGPMQIGIGGASGNNWGGAPVHPAGEQVAGFATDGNGDGIASVYEPADAIAGAAKYLVAHGVQNNVSGAIFAYNHLTSYVQSVLHWAGVYANGGFSVSAASSSGAVIAAQCLAVGGGGGSAQAPSQAVATVIAFARSQIGKPYLWGGTGPDAFDCSGLMMMAYRSVGINIPRTSEEQWTWGPRVAPGHEQPGDLVFFPGSDGTTTSPGHVALVIGHGMMVEAYATGFPIRIASYGTPSSPAGDQNPVGFIRPWAHPGVVLAGGGEPQASGSAGRAGLASGSPLAPQGTPPPSGEGGPVTRQTDCAASPHSCGFPDATNTGPRVASLRSVPSQVSSGPGWSWSNGGVEISGAGTVFAGYSVAGTVDVTASNVTVKDDKITATGDGFGVAIRHASSTTIQDCDISSPSAGDGRLMVAIKDIYGDASGTRVTGNNIWHTSTGVQIGSGLIEGNYIHDMGFQDGDHLNGTTSNGSTTALVIRHNTVFNSHDQTDAISLFEDFGTEGNVLITNNLVAGGGYTIYGGQNPGGPRAFNIRITDNRFATIYFPQGGYWGPVAAFDPSGPGNQWSGNVWDGTGQPVSG